MDAAKFLLSHKWHKMGRWKNPILVLSAMTPAILSGDATAIPFAPSAYIAVNYCQFVHAQDYAGNIHATTLLFEKNLSGTSQELIHEVTESTEKFEKFTPTELTPKIVWQLTNFLRRQVRNWYEIMLADGALFNLYPTSLPASFSLNGVQHTPASLLAQAALPKKLFPMIKERASLLHIAGQIKDGADVSSQLQEHAGKYGWMSAISWWDEPFTASYYQGKAKELAKGEPLKMLEQLDKSRVEQYSHAERLLEIVASKYPRAFECLDAVRNLTDLREENWDVVSSANTRMRPLLRKVASAHGLSTPQLLQLTSSEFVQTLENNSLPTGVDVDELNSRMKNYAIINSAGEEQFFASGGKASELFAILDKEPPKLAELKGTPVWQGVVRGKVRLLQSCEEVVKMRQGEILVCAMSDPDYMPAIRLASAIVTDQGGLLCHAGIVARELQIPCVVGTEYATKLLKDGDEVEVDAVNGIVRKT